MNESLNSQLDAWAFCKKGVSVEGMFDYQQIENLEGKAQVLEPVKVQLLFGMDLEHFSTVVVDWQAKVKVQCERCLEPLKLALSAMNTLALASSNEASKNLPEKYEPLLVPKDALMSLPKLLGEEILLALPLVIRHEDTHCSDKLTKYKAVEELSNQNPFAKLATK